MTLGSCAAVAGTLTLVEFNEGLQKFGVNDLPSTDKAETVLDTIPLIEIEAIKRVNLDKTVCLCLCLCLCRCLISVPCCVAYAPS